MGVKDKVFAQILARGAEPTAADMVFAKKLVGGGGGSVTIVPWSTGTDEEIAAMLAAAHAGKIDLQTDGGWAVGDARNIAIDSFTDGAGVAHSAQSIDIVITSFDEYMNCGNLLQFDFKDALSVGVRMNSSGTNVGGYGSSGMKTATLPALVEALPPWLQNMLIEFSVLASAGDQSSTIDTVANNKLALRSEIEIYGKTTHSKAGEGSQVPYYTTALNRVKKRGHSGSAGYWWERSPRSGSTTDFCAVASGSTANWLNAAVDSGLAPFGCL